jgi:hypothetical protein
MYKKAIAIILSVSVLFGAFTLPANALSISDFKASISNSFYRIADMVVQTLVGGLSSLIKEPGWQNKEDYVSENFYNGMNEDEFEDTASDSARWYVGYSSASLLTGDELDGKHYVGGSLSFTKKVATAVYDDQRVRTVAMSDGRGITVFASLDAYGLANTDIREIRGRLADFANKNNIISINISSLHQHSCVDTFGMNGDLIRAAFIAPINNILGIRNRNGKNEDFMENLYNVVVQSIKDAVDDMTEGQLFFGTVDASEYIKDKRDPQVYDSNLNRLRFVPRDSKKAETWICNGGIHCVGNGAAGTAITGDYPYFIEKYINENEGANFVYIQGAECAISMRTDTISPDEELAAQYSPRYGTLAAYGAKLGELLCSIKNETNVEPILNIASKEVFLPIDNNVLIYAAKCGLLSNTVLKTRTGYEIVSEISYAEFGESLAIIIAPGELAPEIAFGGADTPENSWTGASWDYPALKELVSGRKLIVFGITNDQIGYMLTDNNWHSIFTENEEVDSSGPHAGSLVTEHFIELCGRFN